MDVAARQGDDLAPIRNDRQRRPEQNAAPRQQYGRENNGPDEAEDFASASAAELRIELQRFERDDAGVVTMEGTVAVEASGRPPTIDRLRLSTPVPGAGIADQVAAMSTALGQVADTVAARLAPTNPTRLAP